MFPRRNNWYVPCCSKGLISMLIIYNIAVILTDLFICCTGDICDLMVIFRIHFHSKNPKNDDWISVIFQYYNPQVSGQRANHHCNQRLLSSGWPWKAGAKAVQVAVLQVASASGWSSTERWEVRNIPHPAFATDILRMNCFDTQLLYV